MLTTVREQFIKFFEAHDHLRVPSASLIPRNDATLLFVNSGMAPLKKYFLQEDVPPSKRLVDSQHCLRVGGKHNDLADVGYTKRHHTFFEMLGNFSFGDYFQHEVIPWAWEFLTSVLKLDISRLYVTVHPNDATAFEIWSKIIDQSRITKLEENVWSMGDIGPYGYCSEIFYDLQVGEGDLSNGDRFLEIWNIVFMEFYSDGTPATKDKQVELKAKCIDTGMGLERIVSVLEGVTDTYDIKFFKDALQFLGQTQQSTDSKIFLDHLRSITFMIMEGIIPGPSSREYILRRLMRRALKAFFNFEQLNFKDVVYGILNLWQTSYAHTNFDIDKVFRIFDAEKRQFESILAQGMEKFEEIYAKSNHFTGADLFLLHDTYGFTIDISVDLLKVRHGSFDLPKFEELMEQSKESSRAKSLNIALPYEETQYSDETELNATILGFYDDYIILDKTNFYAQGGGQIGDVGIIYGKDFTLKIVDTKKVDKVYLHKYEIISGSVEEAIKKSENYEVGKSIADVALQVRCYVDHVKKTQIRAHHSATHLLHQALIDLFGDGVKQMGSHVCEDRLRLDFSYPQTLTADDLVRVEDLVNQWIQENHEVVIEWMHFDKAVDAGAKAFFVYDDQVRTIKMGDKSFELCGGSHVRATGDIGLFKILKASATSAGVKRIEAVCAVSAIKHVQKIAAQVKEIASFLKTDEERIMQKLQNAGKKDEAKNIQVQIKKIRDLQIGCCDAGEESQNIEVEAVMKEKGLDIFLVSSQKDGKISLQIKILRIEQLSQKIGALDAKAIMFQLGELVGSRGCGGRKDFAQTGGQTIVEAAVIFGKFYDILENL